METATLLTIGSLIIGGFGALATAISAYLIGKHRTTSADKKTAVEANKVEVEKDKVEVEEKKVEALERRIDLEHHEAIVAGYKDLIAQYQNARDIARNEVHALRDMLNVLTLKVDELTRNHAKCESENKELKGKYDNQQIVLAAQQNELQTQQSELQSLRLELATLVATYGQSNTSATPDAQNAA